MTTKTKTGFTSHVTTREVSAIYTAKDFQDFNETKRDGRPLCDSAKRLLKNRRNLLRDPLEKILFELCM